MLSTVYGIVWNSGKIRSRKQLEPENHLFQDMFQYSQVKADDTDVLFADEYENSDCNAAD